MLLKIDHSGLYNQAINIDGLICGIHIKKGTISKVFIHSGRWL